VRYKNDPRNHRPSVTEPEALGYIANTKPSEKRNSNSETPIEEIRCYNCQNLGHYVGDCTNEKVDLPWKKKGY